MSDGVEKDLIKRLVKADAHIQKIVQEYGLDCFPQEFDVIPAQKMLEIMSYNLPVNYSHWSFGRDYEKQRTQYEYSGGIPYEVVGGSDRDLSFADDSKQGHISRSPERNDQLALEPVRVSNPASERIGFQDSEFASDSR